MLIKKQKGQGMVEFALILPVLLLLLLGIIEAARVIWAYMTVQTAVREAARYAVSGKPYAGDAGSTFCTDPAGDPNATTPWVCGPTTRTVAIENVAMNRITTSLNVSTPCRSNGYSLCEGVPSAYGVRVIGQYTDPLTPGLVITQVGHAGGQGLNVKISAYYNVQMFDPIFDVIMGRRPIAVRGEISMQNEGIDKALGSVIPPAIGNTSNITGSTGTGVGPNGEIIRASNYRVPQGGTLPFRLENHFNMAGPYDVYLSDASNTYLICAGINTIPATNNGDFTCPISGAILPGFYTLYSTLTGNTNPLATDITRQVEVYIGDVPKIKVNNGAGSNIVAVNSKATLEMIAHQNVDGPFNLYVVYGAGPISQTLFTNQSYNANPIWTVPASLLIPSNPCPAGGNVACIIQSRRASNGQLYAQGEFYLNQPQIVIAGGLRTFAENETVYITLKGHSPGIQYDLKITQVPTNTYVSWQGRTLAADALGDVKIPINWTVPQGWPNGSYTISSHPSENFSTPRNPSSMTSANQIASLDVTLNTPLGPYITIDGGYTWPSGSMINIRANKHDPANNPYYFRFGSWRVSIPTSSPVNTFNADSNQSYVAAYNIPLTATVGVTANFTVASYRNSNNSLVAQRNVVVFPVPVIRVVEGSLVSNDAILTIQILNHAPDSTFHIYYANKFLGDILTDSTGQGQLIPKYDLRNLPVTPAPDLSNSANLGVPYYMVSQSLLTNLNVATTTLTLRAPDLRITNVQVPANPALNAMVPVTFTIQNTSPVTITRYFDNDFYLDPSPLAPSFTSGQFNFPGDYKVWRNSVPPSSTFTITQPFFIGSYGPHYLYGYADTSNFVLNEQSELNNILSNTLTINCNPAFITDTFDSGLGNWTTQLYGDADNGGTATTIVSVSSNNRLRVRSDGSSTTGSNDNALAPAQGYTFFRRTTPYTTSAGGLDVRVQVLAAPNNTNGAKAGLELRDSLLPTSPKVEFGLTRSGSAVYRLQMVFRDSVSTVPVVAYQNATNLSLSTTPIWLRIQRYGGTNTFLFYMVQSTAAPTVWGAPVHTATIRLADQLQYGVFMNNNTNGSHQTADFDNFAYSNPYSCLAAQGQPPINNAPPGLTTCSDPLSEQSFETSPPVKWLGVGVQGVQISSGNGRTGNNGLLADTLRGGANNPFFYQQFRMPTPLISTSTSIKLDMYKNVVNDVDGPDANDQFFVALATSPNLSSTISTPALIATGQGATSYNPVNWQQVLVYFSPTSGINFADYADQNLYLLFYNRSNQLTAGCPPLNCHDTQFYFDDVKLSPCTTQPLPETITTRIKGDILLHPLGGSTQKIAGVRVWAYAEGGELYDTVTIQNGEFNFYNLPATTAGVKYFLYSEYVLVDALDPTQVDSLTGNTTVVLTSDNRDANPAETRLDLY